MVQTRIKKDKIPSDLVVMKNNRFKLYMSRKTYLGHFCLQSEKQQKVDGKYFLFAKSGMHPEK